ncbi:MAG: hypothetical protein VKL59_21840 [Nostocaceae cyanobacterium]|nr:hypothetical protein [Nostocaceae cyanobacterium]
MAVRNQQLNNSGYAEPRSRGNGVSTFLSSVSVLLSTLALICSGFAAYQVYTWRQTLLTSRVENRSVISPNPISSSPAVTPISPVSPGVSPQSATTISPLAATSPSPTVTPAKTPLASPTPTPAVEIKPGQFVQPAFGNKVQVELLSLKRIKDPQTGNRDVVNLQMRVRRLAENITPADAIDVYGTTARHPDTSETYKGVSVQRSTGNVVLAPIRPNASADAYVWLRVPPNVNAIDIFVPQTGAFKNVPISN